MQADPSSPPQLVKPKRKQVKAACTNCRQACRGCDEGRPCKRCIKRGIQDTCEDAPRRQRSATAASRLRSGVAKAFQAVRQLAIAPRPSADADTASPSTSSLPSYTTTPRSSFQSPRSSFHHTSSPRSSLQYTHADDIRALFAQQCSISDVMTASHSPTIVPRQLPTLEPPAKAHSPVVAPHGGYTGTLASTFAGVQPSMHRTNSDEMMIAKFEMGRASLDQPRPHPMRTVMNVHAASANMSTGHLPGATQAPTVYVADDAPHVYGPSVGANKRASCTAIDTLHESKRPHWNDTGVPATYQLPLPVEHVSSTGSTSGRSSYEMATASWVDHTMAHALPGPLTPPSHAVQSVYPVVHEEYSI